MTKGGNYKEYPCACKHCPSFAWVRLKGRFWGFCAYIGIIPRVIPLNCVVSDFCPKLKKRG